MTSLIKPILDKKYRAFSMILHDWIIGFNQLEQLDLIWSIWFCFIHWFEWDLMAQTMISKQINETLFNITIRLCSIEEKDFIGCSRRHKWWYYYMFWMIYMIGMIYTWLEWFDSIDLNNSIRFDSIQLELMASTMVMNQLNTTT